ncbi:MAG: tetratricopeptide repeat protein [Bryobacteraceae bacterium]|jgi:predicted CXXCH cytochrome family protein
MRGAPGGWNSHLAIAAVLVVAGVEAERAHPQPAAPPAGDYVDSALCAQCHAEIADHYRKTGMGRSFSHLSGKAPAELTSAKPFYHRASDTYFSMIASGGRYYQRRWQIGFDGRETNLEEKQVDFVVGSGSHSRAYLHLTSRDTLEELPLAWYAEKGGSWGMNPGYDRADFPGATRLVAYQCMFCHNAYPRIPDGHAEEGAEARYLLPLPEGIDCQRCHGPGQRHIAAVGKPGTRPEEVRGTIVNPSRLSPDREIEVCLQCHLETTSLPLPHAIQRRNRGPFSYQPGQALGDFQLSFDRVPGTGERAEVAHEGYRLLESQCFRKSRGNLRCTTCHDPHNALAGETAAAHYNGACLGCHQAAVRRVVAAGSHPLDSACVSCHMPQRRTDEAVHIVMTDHDIRRPPPAMGDPLAVEDASRESPVAAYRGEVVPFYPARLPATAENALDIAVAQLRDGSNLKDGLPRLEALIEKYRPPAAGYYADLADGYVAVEDGARAVRYFEEAVRRAPGSVVLWVRFGTALVKLQQWARAETVLRRATASAGDPSAWGLLGQALWRQNKIAEARLAWETGLKLDPDLPDLHNRLGWLLAAGGQWVEAEAEFRAALGIEPGIAEWQANLANLLASRNKTAEAAYYFERSIRLKPDYASSRLGYARLLANTNRKPEAEIQAKAAVEADVGLADAHELRGYLLAARGELDGAERELRAAVRLDPGFWRAHYELGAVLERRGDAAAAIEHLEIAAQGTDAEAKASARQLLESVRH